MSLTSQLPLLRVAHAGLLWVDTGTSITKLPVGVCRPFCSRVSDPEDADAPPRDARTGAEARPGRKGPPMV